MSRFPSSPQAKTQIEIADQYFYSSRRKEAIAHYNNALSLEPDCVYALVQRGLALQEEGQLEDAMQDYKRAIDLDSQYGPAYYGRGWAKNWLKDYSGELEDARKGLELDPQNPGQYLRRIGAALMGLNRMEEAIQVFSQAIVLAPNDEGTIYNRAVCYLRMGQLESAIKDFDRVIALDSDWAWAYYQRSIAYEQSGDIAQASKDIDAALHFNPNYKPAIQARQRLDQQQRTARLIAPQGSQTASILKIIQTDYAAFLAILVPVVLWGLYGMLLVMGRTPATLQVFLTASAVITLVGVFVLVWRIQTIRALFRDGVQTAATISNIFFYRDRGRIDYGYTFEGQKYLSRNAVHKVKQIQALSVGEQVAVLVDRNNPKRACIRDLYLQE